MPDSRDDERVTKFGELKNAASDADRAIGDLAGSLTELESTRTSSLQRSLFQQLEIERRRRQSKILQKIFQEPDFVAPPQSLFERSLNAAGAGASIGGAAGAAVGRPVAGAAIGGALGAIAPGVIDRLDPTTSVGLALLRDALDSLEAERENALQELAAAEESLEKMAGLGADDKAIRLAPLQNSVEAINIEIEAVIDRLRQVIENTISRAPEDVAKRLKSVDPRLVLDELLSGTEFVPEFREDPRIDPRSPAFRELRDQVGPEGGVVLPLPPELTIGPINDLNNGLEATRDRLSFVRDEMQAVTAVTGNFSDIIEGATGDTMLLGGAFDDLLVGANKSSAGLRETLGQVLPELGDKTDELTIKIEDSMARAREAVEDLAAGLEDVLGEALRGEIESFEEFGRRVLEILREIGFGILEEEGLDPKSLLRKAIGSIFGDDAEGRQGGEGASDGAGEPGPFGALPVVSEEAATALQNAGVAAGLLEGSGLGASDVLGTSLAGEALNAALAAATETAASQTLVGALAQLTVSAQAAAAALQAVAASAGAGGGGGGVSPLGILGSLGGFFGNVSPQGGVDVAGFQGGGLNFGGFERTSIPGGIGGFAAGGNPITGLPALVGERGPEIVVPRVPTTVIPNEVLGGGGGGTTFHVTQVFNINGRLTASEATMLRADARRAGREALGEFKAGISKGGPDARLVGRRR